MKASYFVDAFEHQVEKKLVAILLVLSILLTLLAITQTVMLFFIYQKCTTIYGLTDAGKVYETQTFTCTNSPQVRVVYER